MVIRPTTQEENARAAELFAIDFRRAMVPGAVAPGGEPGKRRWAAFTEEGQMMASMLVTDYIVSFDGHRSPMAAIGGVNTLPPYRRAGCIRGCLETILPQLHAEGCEFSYLYPFSTNYYLQFGYALNKYFSAADIHNNALVYYKIDKNTLTENGIEFR